MRKYIGFITSFVFLFSVFSTVTFLPQIESTNTNKSNEIASSQSISNNSISNYLTSMKNILVEKPFENVKMLFITLIMLTPIIDQVQRFMNKRKEELASA